MKDLRIKAIKIIKQIQYITIASIDKNGMPWNAPVFTAFDENYNFYWGTNRRSQKSQNISLNPNIYLVIYDSTAKSGTGEGVYIRATAKELTDSTEIKKAFKLLEDRHDVPYWDFSAVTKGPIGIYKATPLQIWVNTGDSNDGYYVDVRKDVKL